MSRYCGRLSSRNGIRVNVGAAGASLGAVRHLNVHEYISMEIMQSHGIATPNCKVASTPEEAEEAFLSIRNQRRYY